MAFTIRTACLADVPAMHRVRRAVRENALADPGRVSEASYTRYVVTGSAWVAMTAERTIIGFAALDMADASVWALFVAPGHEGAGIGRALHDTLLDKAVRRGLTTMWLMTASGTRAERFYCRAGWVGTPAVNPGETRFEKVLTG